MKRFYKEVSVGEDFSVGLDGKAIKTPGRMLLVLPARALAEAVAGEWRAQGEKIVPASMPMTKFANTAIDRVAGRKDAIVREVVAYANDLLCYRAKSPVDLVARQSERWNPLLEWTDARYGASLRTGTGIMHVEQSEEALAALRAAVAGFDPFVLTAMHVGAVLLGSLVLALAIEDERLEAAEAFALSRVDEDYQAERWGTDAEAEKRARALAAELEAAARFMRLAKCRYE